ncbi:protein tiptop [Schistocerca americana]|uniref:protein tiptop n=1 Tax=Schistocerca americana TaxID=7009 RepID=UPI001F4F204D|nr:protein tiptop [Schistocerca americana]
MGRFPWEGGEGVVGGAGAAGPDSPGSKAGGGGASCSESAGSASPDRDADAASDCCSPEPEADQEPEAEVDGDADADQERDSEQGADADAEADAEHEADADGDGDAASPDPLHLATAHREPSPRCESRDSRASSGPPRCASRDSLCSEPRAAAAAAAAAGLPLHHHHHLQHQHHQPLHQAPPAASSPPPVLDFSTKSRGPSALDESPVLNLSKPATPELAAGAGAASASQPLDLSVGRKRASIDRDSSPSRSPLPPCSPHPPPRKNSRIDYSQAKPPSVVSPWTSPVMAPHFPYFAAAVSASLSPKQQSQSQPLADAASATVAAAAAVALWNGKLKQAQAAAGFGPTPSPSDATKALEKMSELSKLGGDELFRPQGQAANGAAVAAAGANRHSAWQSHWLNKGADQAKDVLKCVWCKQSFPSLAAMTAHMKEAKHCGVNVPAPPPPPPPPPTTPQQPPTPQPTTPTSNSSTPNSSSGGKPTAADLNLLIKETMPLPRKLVRGQDVWLGKGAEQTRQILKCMWCGQSFRSLAEMTSHMQQTQHYTNIISQEQIISWKSADESKGTGAANAGGGAGAASGAGNAVSGGGGGAGGGGGGGASSHVSAVLTCKVCDQAFSSLKELSNHMVKNSHYKEHIMRSITESGRSRRAPREKRKKSLPVRKLLELERAQHELKNGEKLSLPRDAVTGGRITCEKCGDKIETALFVDHIRQCIGGGAAAANHERNLLKNRLLSTGLVDGHDTLIKDNGRHHRPPSGGSLTATDLSKDGAHNSVTTPSPAGSGDVSSPSVLNAIEKLIEKSFDSRARHGAGMAGYGGAAGAAPMGSSILKRLGIDESVDYTKPLVDAQTMNLLRSYHHHHHQQQGYMHQRSRERSGSESSSVSGRVTPANAATTPRTTPEKRVQTPPTSVKSEPPSTPVAADEEPLPAAPPVKKEAPPTPNEEDHSTSPAPTIVVKKEASEPEEEQEEDRQQRERRSEDREEENVARSPGTASSPCRSSPASSERSNTPHKKSSLGALSSMFDSLSGGGGPGGSAGADGPGSAGSSAGGGSRTSSSHPLAALQKLCDKTERHGGGRSSSSGSSSAAGIPPGPAGAAVPNSTPGAILAFSWACNDAVVTADSIMKCAFCDTPFISKGAYRHHLSKMHFVKDGVIPDPVALKAAQQQAAAAAGAASGAGPASTPGAGASGAPTVVKGSPSGSSASGVNSGGGSSTPSGSGGNGGSGAKSPQTPSSFEESPHSKFLKYTELAKQLSSKYV